MSDIAKHFIEVIRHVDEAHKFRSGAYEIEKHRDCAAWLSHEAAHDLADAIEARDAELRDWQDSSEAYRKDCEAAESRAEQAERALGSARAELDVADANHRQMAKQLADLGRSLAEARTELCETQLVLEQTERNAARVIAEAVTVIQQGESATNAAYSQAMAEYHGHDKTADKHDRSVTAFRHTARQFVKEHGNG